MPYFENVTLITRCRKRKRNLVCNVAGEVKSNQVGLGYQQGDIVPDLLKKLRIFAQ